MDQKDITIGNMKTDIDAASCNECPNPDTINALNHPSLILAENRLQYFLLPVYFTTILKTHWVGNLISDLILK